MTFHGHRSPDGPQKPGGSQWDRIPTLSVNWLWHIWTYLSEDITTQVLHMLLLTSKVRLGEVKQIREQMKDVGILIIKPSFQQTLGPVILAQQKA